MGQRRRRAEIDFGAGRCACREFERALLANWTSASSPPTSRPDARSLSCAARQGETRRWTPRTCRSISCGPAPSVSIGSRRLAQQRGRPRRRNRSACRRSLDTRASGQGAVVNGTAPGRHWLCAMDSDRRIRAWSAERDRRFERGAYRPAMSIRGAGRRTGRSWRVDSTPVRRRLVSPHRRRGLGATPRRPGTTFARGRDVGSTPPHGVGCRSTTDGGYMPGSGGVSPGVYVRRRSTHGWLRGSATVRERLVRPFSSACVRLGSLSWGEPTGRIIVMDPTTGERQPPHVTNMTGCR